MAGPEVFRIAEIYSPSTPLTPLTVRRLRGECRNENKERASYAQAIDSLDWAEPAMPSEAPKDKTILVAEDNRTVRDWLAFVLQAEGYRVVLAANGQEALNHLWTGPRPDLIMLDMLMPVLDGWHFLTQLKRQTPKPSIPIMIVTATILTPAWAQAHGCCGFIKKPIQADELLAEVRRCLAVPPTGSQTLAPP